MLLLKRHQTFMLLAISCIPAYCTQRALEAVRPLYKLFMKVSVECVHMPFSVRCMPSLEGGKK